MKKYHIGQGIMKEVKAKYVSLAVFARDFFRVFSEKCLNGKVTVVDKQTAENCITHLLPESELHIFSPICATA